MHDSRLEKECFRVGLDARERVSADAIMFLMPVQNRFGAVDREQADGMVMF